MLIQVAFDIAAIAGVVWFWGRAAEPTLRALGARPLARHLGLGATLFATATLLVHLAAVLTGQGEVGATWLRILGGFFWIVIVGLGYPRYGFLRRMTEPRTRNP
jgi:hypothetical protein